MSNDTPMERLKAAVEALDKYAALWRSNPPAANQILDAATTIRDANAELLAAARAVLAAPDAELAELKAWRKMHMRFTRADGMDLLGEYVEAGDKLAAKLGRK